MVRTYAVEISDAINPDAFKKFERDWSPEQEIVRCNDCKYYDGNGTCMKNGIALLTDHWFCADGERGNRDA